MELTHIATYKKNNNLTSYISKKTKQLVKTSFSSRQQFK